MTLRVAVDFGTSSTCVAVSVHGRDPQVVAVDGHPLMSSAVYADVDGTLFVGQEADRHAAVDPSRYEPHPKRRIDERELLLGASVVPARDAIRAVLTRAVAEARRFAGGAEVDQLVLTHPADWGGVRTQVLRQSAVALAHRTTLIPEPVAAAVFHTVFHTASRTFPSRESYAPDPRVVRSRPASPPFALAVLDVGGGTVDVSVVRAVPRPPGATRTPAFQVLATRGDPHFGGADVDQLLLDHVGSVVGGVDDDAWRALIEGRELPDRRRRRVIHQDVRGAKETLSRHAYTDVPMPPPFPDVHVTRDDLERLIGPSVDRAAELTAATIRESGVRPPDLAGIFLVGGSSRIPLVSRLVHQRTGVVPTTLDQPETVVARGALRATADTSAPAEPARPTRPPPPPPPAPAPPPPPPGPTPRVRRLLAAGALLVVAATVAVAVLALTSDDDPVRRATPTTSTQPPQRPSRVIAQYEYQFALPDGWRQTGGDGDLLRTELKPVGREREADRLLVEQKRLAFDSTEDRARAVGGLRADYERSDGRFTGFDEDARFAGRDVIHYREQLSDALVRWYVIFDGRAQVSVGCQYGTDGRREPVDAACETVVRSLTVIG
ncbi:type VII secretion-associated protein [Actinophytocola gossypii]|uniref:Type VII secretion-associated protein n=1 Tax=Actinophytocola gossypii TaxID=2812003 RepID=A0ABT2JHQ0_9PSEU|nr:type VII secretion-associated protein [Actinophytocola gossypii]MCT2587407.1 type VII secretion-associated protein [Actinophytocola gossypii]